MKVIILGAGRVGFEVAKELSLQENDVSVVDSSKETLSKVSEKLDVKPVLGHATDLDVLKDAGLASADILIAATSSDEINITACQIADFAFHTKTKIARINRNSYFSEDRLFEKGKFSIDFVVSPSYEVTKMVRRIVSIPGAVDVMSCVNNKLRVIGVICKKGSPLADVQLKYISAVDIESKLAILYIKKSNNQEILPNSIDVIKPGDEVYFACDFESINYAMNLFGYSVGDKSNLVFIGGTKICEEIVNNISNPDIFVKVIENNFYRAEELSENLSNAEILHGDLLDSEVLKSANIVNSDLVISVTDDDKINILSCLVSKRLGAKRVAAILNDSAYSDILYSLGINSILDSRSASVSKILHHIRKGDVEDIISFNNGEIEIFSIDVLNNSHAVGVLIDDISSKNDVYIPAIVRGNKVFILPKRMLINAGDRILFIARKQSIERIMKLFQEKPKYLI